MLGNRTTSEFNGSTVPAATIVPEAMVESFESEVDKPLRTILDPVWNAAGWPHSINFDDDGKWRPHE
jgi:hypothetical protein